MLKDRPSSEWVVASVRFWDWTTTWTKPEPHKNQTVRSRDGKLGSLSISTMEKKLRRCPKLDRVWSKTRQTMVVFIKRYIFRTAFCREALMAMIDMIHRVWNVFLLHHTVYTTCMHIIYIKKCTNCWHSQDNLCNWSTPVNEISSYVVIFQLGLKNDYLVSVMQYANIYLELVEPTNESHSIS